MSKTKNKEEIIKIVRSITTQFEEVEVYTGKEIKQKIEQTFPGTVEFDDEKPARKKKSDKPFKKK